MINLELYKKKQSKFDGVKIRDCNDLHIQDKSKKKLIGKYTII